MLGTRTCPEADPAKQLHAQSDLWHVMLTYSAHAVRISGLFETSS